jgi:hypothetical protein
MERAFLSDLDPARWAPKRLPAGLRQHRTSTAPEGPVLLAVDEEFVEGAAPGLWSSSRCRERLVQLI